MNRLGVSALAPEDSVDYLVAFRDELLASARPSIARTAQPSRV
ncbi:hypothetical protein [Nocardia sp. NPDC048505]